MKKLQHRFTSNFRRWALVYHSTDFKFGNDQQPVLDTGFLKDLFYDCTLKIGESVRPWWRKALSECSCFDCY